ncbi:hypothetical protein J4Q44_G00082080 [Coregonus suidteri]|uniref:Uncharacterized protein n=1 Tax=Coregonus suidteri TaxID=861788 RepID=A0AAN8RBU7_9TELE
MRDHLKAKGVMAGTQGKWQTLPSATKAHYSEEADKLQAGGQELKENLKALKVKYYLRRLKSMVGIYTVRLSSWKVDTAFLVHNPEVGTGKEFVEGQDLIGKFSVHFSGKPAASQSKGFDKARGQGIHALFNQKYNEAGGQGRVPYMAVACQLGVVLGLELELGVELGLELGVELGLEMGVELGLELGVELGLELGVELGVELGLELGVELGLELGVELGLELGVELGLELGVELGLELGVELEMGLELGVELELEQGL